MAEAITGEPWVHPLCPRLDTDSRGPLVALRDSRLLTVNGQGLRFSQDDGKTWRETVPAAFGQKPEEEPCSCHVLETTNGTLVMVYLDLKAKQRKWFNADPIPLGLRMREEQLIGAIAKNKPTK